MNRKKYDIFISYRREGGFAIADAIKQRLENAHYSVFLDVDVLNNGKFKEILLKRVEDCIDFIIILPQDGLTRCADENDWVRKEIEWALKNRKNIIPVMLYKESWGDIHLPNSLIELQNYNCINVSDPTVFSEKIERLKNKYLHSKPMNFLKRNKNIIVSIAIIFVVMILLTCTYLIKQKKIYNDLCIMTNNKMSEQIIIIDSIIVNRAFSNLYTESIKPDILNSEYDDTS